MTRSRRAIGGLALAFSLLYLSVDGGETNAACTTANCGEECIAWTGWCFQNVAGKSHDEFMQAVVQAGCTNGTRGGTPALLKQVQYDTYNGCTFDCNQDSMGTAVKGGRKTNIA